MGCNWAATDTPGLKSTLFPTNFSVCPRLAHSSLHWLTFKAMYINFCSLDDKNCIFKSMVLWKSHLPDAGTMKKSLLSLKEKSINGRW